MEETKKAFPVLHLNLTKNWFEMVESGVKKEEYRRICPYWNRVFIKGKIKIKGEFYNPTEIMICFSNGYSHNRPQNYFLCNDLRVGFGLREWGANPGEKCFILEIGDILPF